MEFRISTSGKKLLTQEQKAQILREQDSGVNAAELSRKYGIPMQSIYKWRHNLKSSSVLQIQKPFAEVASMDELKKALSEIKLLRQALGKMTLDRDILQDAVNIATKKKWL